MSDTECFEDYIYRMVYGSSRETYPRLPLTTSTAIATTTTTSTANASRVSLKHAANSKIQEDVSFMIPCYKCSSNFCYCLQ